MKPCRGRVLMEISIFRFHVNFRGVTWHQHWWHSMNYRKSEVFFIGVSAVCTFQPPGIWVREVSRYATWGVGDPQDGLAMVLIVKFSGKLAVFQTQWPQDTMKAWIFEDIPKMILLLPGKSPWFGWHLDALRVAVSEELIELHVLKNNLLGRTLCWFPCVVV